MRHSALRDGQRTNSPLALRLTEINRIGDGIVAGDNTAAVHHGLQSVLQPFIVNAFVLHVAIRVPADVGIGNKLIRRRIPSAVATVNLAQRIAVKDQHFVVDARQRRRDVLHGITGIIVLFPPGKINGQYGLIDRTFPDQRRNLPILRIGLPEIRQVVNLIVSSRVPA